MAEPPAPHALRERALLHQGGPAATWGNLGLWPPAGQPQPAYAEAAAALAAAVGQAAALAPGQRVISLACGAGDELLLWHQQFGAAAVLGSEIDPVLRAAAQHRIDACGLTSAITLSAMPLAPDTAAALRQAAGGPVDALLCVDAAYHLSPRPAWLQACAALLRPGGRLAFTDLVLASGEPAGAGLRAAAGLCGVDAADLVSSAQRLAQLQAAGFDDLQCQPLDEAVLGGFARFARRQGAVLGAAAWQPAWWRVALTARLIGPARAAGLGYALFSARRTGA